MRALPSQQPRAAGIRTPLQQCSTRGCTIERTGIHVRRGCNNFPSYFTTTSSGAKGSVVDQRCGADLDITRVIRKGGFNYWAEVRLTRWSALLASPSDGPATRTGTTGGPPH